MSLKQIANSLKISESVITKSCKNVHFKGFKDLKQHLLKQYYYKKDKNLENDFYYSLTNDLKSSHNVLDFDLIEKISNDICKNQNKVIIFATGKTNIIARYFYLTLLEYGLKVQLVQSLYDEPALDVENAIIFVISISGNNSMIDRYLNVLCSMQQKLTIALTATVNFISKKNVDIHLYGEVKQYFAIDQKANPFTEKYIMMYLIDNLLLNFFEKLSKSNLTFFANVKSRNFI